MKNCYKVLLVTVILALISHQYLNSSKGVEEITEFSSSENHAVLIKDGTASGHKSSVFAPVLPVEQKKLKRIILQKSSPDLHKKYDFKFTWRDNFKDSRIIDFREEFVNSENKLKRESLIEVSGMKYPFLKIEEHFDLDNLSEEEGPSFYVEYVASHLIVNINEELAFEDIHADLNTRAIRQLSGDKYILEFNEFDLDTVDSAVNHLANLNGVKYAEPDYLVHTSVTPNDNDYSELWGLHNTGQTGGTADADIDAPEAWDITTGSRNIIVAVIDTGVDYTHTDLAANMWKNPGETGTDSNGNDKASNGIDDDGNGYVDDVFGYDFINNDSDPIDNDHYHGTHCAGTIGGVGNNESGVVGVNWQVKMMAIKFLGASGGYTSDAIQSVEYATAMGAHLSSNSWGGGGYSQALKDAIDDAGSKGSLFIAAAGNSGRDADSSAHYPSSYTSANVVSVAATDHNDNLAGFSNYGLQSVDIGAPGVAVYSTSPDNSYRSLSGTSMATPHVSGVVALLLNEFPSETMYEIKNRLFSSGDSISSLSGKTVTGRRLNAYNALTYNENRAVLTSPDSGEFESATVTFSWSEGVNVSSYRLILGASRGGTDFYDSGNTSAKTATITDLPVDGSLVYVRLYSKIDGVDEFHEYIFKSYTDEAYKPAPSEMSSPVNNSTFTSADVTFTWSDGRQVSRNWLYIGTYEGARNLYSSQVNTGVTVSFPVDGRKVYVRLWSELPEGWTYKDYTYTCFYDENNLSEKSILESPDDGSTLTDENVTFVCSTGKKVDSKYIYIGSSKGGFDVGHGNITDSKQFYIVPDSSQVYVRLWSRIYGVWEYNDYQFTAHYDEEKLPVPSELVSPVDGTEFDSDEVTFEWTEGKSVNRRMIYMGTAQGSGDLLTSYLTGESSQSLTVPTTGQSVHVRLWSQLPNGWKYKDYQYTLANIEPKKAEIISPENGLTFSSNNVSFKWNSGVGVRYKYLFVGSGEGKTDIVYKFISEREGELGVEVPVDGRDIYARLYSYVNGKWEFSDYKYTTYDNRADRYVSHLYNNILNRNGGLEDISGWKNVLQFGESGAADVVRLFINSQEFKNRNLTTGDFVDVLYRALLGREADLNGKQYWVGELKSGMSEQQVIQKFLYTTEFTQFVESFGLTAIHPLERFVARFYRECLGREADLSGLFDWREHLNNQTRGGAEIALGFVLSQEFANRNLSNEEFLRVLYRAFFDREPDSGGFNDWLLKLSNGLSRRNVLNGFLNGAEFSNLCESFGIVVTSSSSSSYETSSHNFSSSSTVSYFNLPLLDKKNYLDDVAYSKIDNRVNFTAYIRSLGEMHLVHFIANESLNISNDDEAYSIFYPIDTDPLDLLKIVFGDYEILEIY